MTDMLEIVKPLLKEDGIEMEIVILSDNIQPNSALANKEVDQTFSNTLHIWKMSNEETIPTWEPYNLYIMQFWALTLLNIIASMSDQKRHK